MACNSMFTIYMILLVHVLQSGAQYPNIGNSGSQIGNNPGPPWINNGNPEHNQNNPGGNYRQQQFCEDKHNDCAGLEMYCHGKNSEWMNINCQRTCGKCHARPQQQHVDCQWSEWQYGPCSRTCGRGERMISRTEKVKAQNGGKPCFGSGMKTEHCYMQDCPDVVDCQWSEWHYGPCSRTCGSGVQMITRTERVKAQNGGRPCFGDGTNTEYCNIQDCATDCQWSEWHYGPCSRTCGSGERLISRTENVKALNGGRPCFGDRTKTEYCNNQDCPVDCQWSAWNKEGNCSRSCGGGKQIFSRREEIKSKNGGRPCSGSDTTIETCNDHDCFEPVHCQWSPWSKVGPCSKACGKGIQNYRRRKLPFTANGKDCIGKKTGQKYCNTQRCPIIRPNGPGSGCSVECKSISCEVSKGSGAKAAMGSCFLPPYQTTCSGLPSGCGSCVSQCSNGQN